MYGPTDYRWRKLIWPELLSLIEYCTEACCLGEDINMTRPGGEWFPEGRITCSMRKFNKFIEVPLLNGKFSVKRVQQSHSSPGFLIPFGHTRTPKVVTPEFWMQIGKTQTFQCQPYSSPDFLIVYLFPLPQPHPRSLLDKLLVYFDWDEAFANTKATQQVRTSSDHFSILLEAGAYKWGPLSPFIFCKNWLLDKYCCRMIENSLSLSTPPGWMGFTLTNKLWNIKGQLKFWHSDYKREQKSPLGWMGFALSNKLQNIKGQLKSWHSYYKREQKSHEETVTPCPKCHSMRQDEGVPPRHSLRMSP
uniref:Uncharacterized protein n=1 Tax=Cucumis melo TaxID=3656 RepID=A0A9I9EEF8_CUCME